MATLNRLALLKLFDEQIGDDLEFNTTTNITTDKSVISTTLNQFDGAGDGFGDNVKWLYITTGNNAETERKVGSTTYATTTGTLYVYGANLLSESGAVTCRLTNYAYSKKVNAVNRALEFLSDVLFIPLDDSTLVTGNLIPDGHFEWWTDSTTHKFLSTSSADLAQTTSAGLYRGQRGTTSMKVTPSAGNGYAYLNSDTWPGLLGAMNKNVSFYSRALPQTADDAKIQIYTKQADGTEQTGLISSTSAPAGEFTLLELEDQTLNDDLVEVELRWKVTTSGQYVYFDDAVFCGETIHDLLLPENFQNGHVSQVHIQSSGYSDKIYNDIHPKNWYPQEHDIITDVDSTYKYLHLKELNSNYRRINLKGYKSISTLSSDSDTIPFSDERVNLIIAYAAYLLYRGEEEPISSEDVARYGRSSAKWYRSYQELLLGTMMTPPHDLIRTN